MLVMGVHNCPADFGASPVENENTIGWRRNTRSNSYTYRGCYPIMERVSSGFLEILVEVKVV